MTRVQKCDLCGREIRGPAYWRHSDACRIKHGQKSGKVWREMCLRIARESSSVLTALSKRPEVHLEEIFGRGPVSPQDIIDALNAAGLRKSLNWVMGCSWGWRKLLDQNEALWPKDQREALWGTIWEAYDSMFDQNKGGVPRMRREAGGEGTRPARPEPKRRN